MFEPRKLLMAVCTAVGVLRAAQLLVYPNPAMEQGTGVAFLCVNNAATYNIDIGIYDGVGNEENRHVVHNYVINNSTRQHVFYTWDLRNKNGRFVGSDSYLARVSMTNAATGATVTLNHKFGVFSTYPETGSWIPAYHVEVLSDVSGDKVYRFPSMTSHTKAIISFKGWDPCNATDGVQVCFKDYFLFMGTESERYNGWDLYFVVWKDAGASLDENVTHAIEAVNTISTRYGKYAEIVLKGFSMGAILGRYALAKSESDGSPLPVSKFISIEGEQQGAQMNFCMQAAVYRLYNSGDPLFEFGRFVDWPSAVTVQDKLAMLFTRSAKEMLYYHVGLVEGSVKSGLSDDYPVDITNIDQVRSTATAWHDAFYSRLRTFGKCAGGYPSLCKNYAVSLSSSDLYYTDKNKNQQMGILNARAAHKIASDIRDLDPASFASLEDLQEAGTYAAVNGYDYLINFCRLESALDLQDMAYAKSGERIVQKLSPNELEQKSRFDKVYIRPDGLRQEHLTNYDDLLIDQIRAILADNTPKQGCKMFPEDTPASTAPRIIFHYR